MTTFGWMVFLGFLGIVSSLLHGSAVSGLVFGALVGFFIGRTSELRSRLEALESALDALRSERQASPGRLDPAQTALSPDAGQGEGTRIPALPLASRAAAQPSADAAAETAPKANEAAPSVPAPWPASPVKSPWAGQDAPEPVMETASAAAADEPAATGAVGEPSGAPMSPGVPATPQPAPFDLAAWFKGWLADGNVPVAVGMLVLFGGVGALLKYASDHGWLRLTIMTRLSAAAVVSVLALGFAWRQRHRRRSFSLGLQGGSLGVLILLVFAAFRLYHLLPAGLAFGAVLVLVAATGALAVRQDALLLALLGTVAGFVAPLLISTGSNNHVALFTYYGVLNVALLGIAWFRSWRVLNLVGFAFTFGVGTAWGFLQYRPSLFASTEPFLVLFFALYLAIPVLYALRQAPGRRGIVDAVLVYGTPLLAFPLQVFLVDGARRPLALTALVLAGIYAELALVLRRPQMRLLRLSFASLAVGFAILVVPLGLSAQFTVCAWAVQGAALTWFGLRRQSPLAQWAGLALQLCAGMVHSLWPESSGPAWVPVFNATLLGAAVVSGSGLTTAWLCARAGPESLRPDPRLALAWGVFWWFYGGLAEIHRSVPDRHEAGAALLFIAASGWLAAEVARRRSWPAVQWVTALTFAALLPLIVWTGDTRHGTSGWWGTAAWAAVALAGARSLMCLREAERGLRGAAWLAWLWTWPLLFTLRLHEMFKANPAPGPDWSFSLAVLPLLLGFWLVLVRPAWSTWPLREARFPWRTGALVSFGLTLLGVLVMSLPRAGVPGPLPYLPVLNSIETLQVGLVLLLWRWLHDESCREWPLAEPASRRWLLASAGFTLVSFATVRAVHHLAELPWDPSLLHEAAAQSGLTVVWSILGVVAWIGGSRGGNRQLWRTGAVLMAVVLAKLAIVDRGHLGSLGGIASFLAYGTLCTVVGFLAPAPPREAVAEQPE